MESKNANPFLFMEEESYVSPPSSSNNSNPFLMGDSDYSNDFTASDNPFLSQTAVSAASTAATATNPFAFDAMDYAPVEALPAEMPHFQDNSQDMFSNPSAVTNTTNDFFNSVSDMMPNDSASLGQTILQKPTGLDLKHTNTVSQSENVIVYSSDEELSKANQPKRPPPPGRPVIPPSKETQDLIMTVMGAMDATSSHLLDRIPPTRTPSPVSIRDLHSPSPTPEPTFADLLDVSDNRPPAAQMDFLQDSNDNEPQQMVDNVNLMQPQQDNQPDFLMGLNEEPPPCDINQNPPPSRPVAPPSRPPRPTPPKPPPPSFINHMQQEPQETAPPENVPEPVQEQNVQGGFMDMFGAEEVPSHKPQASTADIMSLYSAPTVTKPQTATDLLFDSMDNTESMTPMSADNYISPEPTSQTDLQMDTSDSQSKGSVSSVTFNPFGGTEEAAVPMALPSPNKTPVEFAMQPEVVQQEVSPVPEFVSDSSMPAYDPPPPEMETAPAVVSVHEHVAQPEVVHADSVPPVHPEDGFHHVAPAVPATHPHAPPEDSVHHESPPVPAAHPHVRPEDGFQHAPPPVPAVHPHVHPEDGFHQVPAVHPHVHPEDGFHHAPPPVPAAHPHVHPEDGFHHAPPPVPAAHPHVHPEEGFHQVPPAVPAVHPEEGFHQVPPAVPAVHPHAPAGDAFHVPPAVHPHVPAANGHHVVHPHVPPPVPPPHVASHVTPHVPPPPPARSPIRAAPPPVPPHHVHTVHHNETSPFGAPANQSDAFDAFSAKFDSVAKEESKGAFDPFSGGGGGGGGGTNGGGDAWGNDAGGFNDTSAGFGAEEPFDAFLSMQAPPAPPTAGFGKGESQDSDEDKDFAVFIR